MINICHGLLVLAVNPLIEIVADISRYRFNDLILQIPASKLQVNGLKLYAFKTISEHDLYIDSTEFLNLKNNAVFRSMKNIVNESIRNQPLLDFDNYLIQNYQNLEILNEFSNNKNFFFISSYMGNNSGKYLNRLTSLYEIGIILSIEEFQFPSILLSMNYNEPNVDSLEQFLEYFSNPIYPLPINYRELLYSEKKMHFEEIFSGLGYPSEIFSKLHCYGKDYFRYKELMDYTTILTYLLGYNPIDTIEYIFSLNKINPSYNGPVLNINIYDIDNRIYIFEKIDIYFNDNGRLDFSTIGIEEKEFLNNKIIDINIWYNQGNKREQNLIALPSHIILKRFIEEEYTRDTFYNYYMVLNENYKNSFFILKEIIDEGIYIFSDSNFNQNTDYENENGFIIGTDDTIPNIYINKVNDGNIRVEANIDNRPRTVIFPEGLKDNALFYLKRLYFHDKIGGVVAYLDQEFLPRSSEQYIGEFSFEDSLNNAVGDTKVFYNYRGKFTTFIHLSETNPLFELIKNQSSSNISIFLESYLKKLGIYSAREIFKGEEKK